MGDVGGVGTMRETYEETRRRHLACFGAALGPSVAALELGADDLARLREQRLRHVLGVAKAASPWHRERLAAIDPATATEAGLGRLPPMTKDDLMASFDTVATDPRVTRDAVERHVERLRGDAYLLGDLHAIASGGSTGRRGLFVWGWDAWAEGFASIIRHLVRARGRDPEGLGGPGPIAIVAASSAAHATGAMPATFRSPMLDVVPLPVTAPLADVVAGLNRVQPRVLTGYASALADLVEEARAGRLRISPAGVISTSEPLTPAIRDGIGDVWPARVANSWATSEFAATGTGCFEGDGMHLSDDLLVYEFVDEEGRPVPEGAPAAKAYVTNLYNTVLPLIRYELTDEVRPLPGPCPCGSAHRRVADIEGRVDDVFAYAGGVRVHPHVFRSVLARWGAVTEYRVVQTPAGADLEVKCRGAIDVAALGDAVAGQLAGAGLSHAAVAVRAVAAIERQPTGKIRRFVPLPR